MKGKAVLAPWTAGAATFAVTVCMTVIQMRSMILKSAGEGTLLWMAFAILSATLGVYLNLSLVETPLAPWAAGIRDSLRFPRALFYLTGAGLMLNTWVELLAGTELPSTPRIVSSLLTIFVAAYAVRLGIVTTVRVSGLIGVLTVLPLYAIAVAAFPGVDLSRLLPHPLGTGAIPLIWPTIIFAPRGYDVLPVIAPLVEGSMRRSAYLGVGLGAVFVLLAVVMPQLVLGLKTATALPDPFVSLIGTISSVYLPFQRIAFLMFVIFEMTIFAVVTMYSISGIASLGIRVYPLTPWYATVPWLLGVLLLSLPAMPTDVSVDVKNTWSIFGVILYFALPALILVLGRVRVSQREAAE